MSFGYIDVIPSQPSRIPSTSPNPIHELVHSCNSTRTTSITSCTDLRSDYYSAQVSGLQTDILQLSASRAMHIQSIPMWEGTGNNYAYLVSDDKTREAVIIDPAHPKEVLPVLDEKTKAGLKLSTIINTHHHHDHAGGNEEIASVTHPFHRSPIDLSQLKHYPLPIIGGRDCTRVTKTPAHKETFNIGSISVTALHTPCHTQDSVCFFFQDGSDKAVFTGDTLFIGGCGRFFEGTAPEMHKALNETLAALPDDTKVFPGHEYTKGNVKFAKTVAGDNEAVQKLDSYSQANKETQGKFTIGDEKKHNVFMLYADPKIQKAVGQTEPVEVVKALRAMKDKS
ncbi:Cytoplasmic glyoxalase II [Curvularia kusanoi]|uniref:hydroxyacylglutathione hydrolase n=1 Tax=Curvularia kusanoi TaxID=90978 RepID=A0A9P4T5Q0_CURKU|nr:Cytoplasmic glyoxalase II [Curvularia kusanoi]